jgi:hypothetical protein
MSSEGDLDSNSTNDLLRRLLLEQGDALRVRLSAVAVSCLLLCVRPYNRCGAIQ